MGSGKGNPERWVAVVKPGRVLFELSYPDEESPVAPSSGPSRSCRSRHASSPARRASDGQEPTPPSEGIADSEPVDSCGERSVKSCSTCVSSNATGQLDNSARLGKSSEQIARINTELREREIAAAEREHA
jgi:hypothetical protein